MKKTYKVLAIALTFSAFINLVGCHSKNDDNIKSTSVQENIINKLKEQNSKNDNDENKLLSEENTEEKIVQPGYEEIESYLDGEWEGKRFQGVALIAEGDEIKFAKAYGYADLDENRKNKLTTRFAIASNTKQITATAVMQLVEKGKINLDDTIDKYFPKFQYSNQITVRELLQMRSGLVDYLNDPDIYMSDAESLKILDDYKDAKYFDAYVGDERWTSDLILNDLYLSELKFEPGQAYDYCNTNYYLLGLIIEQAAGMSYEEYISKYIFEPCGMKDASMEAKETDAKGHGSKESGPIVANPNFTYAAGNIYANVYDILKFMRMLHKGDIISDESYNQMTTPADDQGYGFGLFIKDGAIRHSGVIDGFNSYTTYDPVNDISIIMVENCDETTELLEAKYDAEVVRGMLQ